MDEKVMAKMMEFAVKNSTREALEKVEKRILEAVDFDNMSDADRKACLKAVRQAMREESIDYFNIGAEQFGSDG